MKKLPSLHEENKSENSLNTHAINPKSENKKDRVPTVYSDGESFTLPLALIKIFEHNSRVAKNVKYEELKSSIVQTGFRDTLSVTLIPNEQLYTLSAGGGTRFTILKELYEETKDEKYNQVKVVFSVYVSEEVLLYNHWSENELRDPLCFIDNAFAIFRAKKTIEEKLGRSLSLRDASVKLIEANYSGVGKSSLTEMFYAIQHLEPKIPTLLRSHKLSINDKPGMGSRLVADIRKYYNISLEQFVNSSINNEKSDWYDIYFETLASYDKNSHFDIDSFKRAIIKKFAKVENSDVEELADSFEKKVTKKSGTDNVSIENTDVTLDNSSVLLNEDLTTENSDLSNAIKKDEDCKIEKYTTPATNILSEPNAIRKIIHKCVLDFVQDTKIAKCISKTSSGIGFRLAIPSKKINEFEASIWWMLCQMADIDKAPIDILNKEYPTFNITMKDTFDTVCPLFWIAYTDGALSSSSIELCLSIFMKETNNTRLLALHKIQYEYVQLLKISDGNIWKD